MSSSQIDSNACSRACSMAIYCWFIGVDLWLWSGEPRHLFVVFLLERLDLFNVLHHESDVVQAFQQALLVIDIDLEAVGCAIGAGHGLRFEIDRDLRAGLLAQLLAQFLTGRVG